MYINITSETCVLEKKLYGYCWIRLFRGIIVEQIKYQKNYQKCKKKKKLFPR